MMPSKQQLGWLGQPGGSSDFRKMVHNRQQIYGLPKKQNIVVNFSILFLLIQIGCILNQ
jgi:hypothetical protein